MKTIFITGVQGFIGSHLAIKLYELGYNIIGGDISELSDTLSNYQDNHPEVTSRMDLFTIDFANIKNSTMFDNVDLIIHLASPIGVDNVIKYPNETLREASKINSNIDEICSRYNIPIIYASSSEVFGSGPIDEDSIYSIKKLEDSNRWSYAASKVYGEMLFGTGYYQSTIVRFFNVCGVGQKTNGMVIPTFVSAAIKDEPLIIKEDGIRNYCDVRDAIAQLTFIIESLLKGESTFVGDFNIGSGLDDNTISVTELAAIVLDVFDSNSTIEYQETKEALPKRILTGTVQEISEIGTVGYSIIDILDSIFEDKFLANMIEEEEI